MKLCAGHRSYLAVDGIFGVDICQTGLPHRRQWSGIWNGIFHFLDGTLQSGSSLNRFGTGDAFFVWGNVHRHTSGQTGGFMGESSDQIGRAAWRERRGMWRGEVGAESELE